jgi:hypothetical protein
MIDAARAQRLMVLFGMMPQIRQQIDDPVAEGDIDLVLPRRRVRRDLVFDRHRSR